MSDYVPFKGSAVWEHFLRERGGQTAKCKRCNKVLKISGGSTKGLHVHLKTNHPHLCAGSSAESGTSSQSSSGDRGPAQKKRKTIDSYFPTYAEEDLDSILARMCARDGMPFSVFCTSPDLRSLLASKGFKNVPTHHDTIKKRVMVHCAQVKMEVKSEMKDSLTDGSRFSLTVDEYTSLRNRRYMSINVHCGEQVWGLGVIRCLGSMTAERCVDLLKEKLAEFGLNLQHVMGVTSDGAAVMVKFGKQLPCDHQLCLAHGIHLAVVDVLYTDIAHRRGDGDSDDSAGEDEEGIRTESFPNFGVRN